MAVDSGVIVNPITASGQIEGGMTQALGYAVCEEMVYDEHGRARERDLRDYHIFRADEMPALETIFVETFEPSHPFGVKAVAEIPMDGVAPAVGNAVLDACGAEMNDNPDHAGAFVACSWLQEKNKPKMSRIYVIGHVNPDTDSIASAMGYAWLLQPAGWPTISSPPAPGRSTRRPAWVLKRLGLEPPLLLTDASPRFESVMRRLDSTAPDQPLARRLGYRQPHLGHRPGGQRRRHALRSRHRLQPVRLHQPDWWARTRTARRCASPRFWICPCREACNTAVPQLPEPAAASAMRSTASCEKKAMISGWWMKTGLYMGVCRQRDVLNPPRLRLILVDHNEPRQALGSLDEAELLEILDHHRLGNSSTHIPIRFTVDVVGSTSTLVSERIEDAGLSAPPPLAGLLLAGLLSDTLILTSPTTTDARSPRRRAPGALGFRAQRAPGWRDHPILRSTSAACRLRACQPGAGRDRQHRSEDVRSRRAALCHRPGRSHRPDAAR